MQRVRGRACGRLLQCPCLAERVWVSVWVWIWVCKAARSCSGKEKADAQRAAQDELLAMLEEEELKDAALCVFANKQDLPGALTSAQITEALGLAAVKGRSWAIFQTSAVKGEGLNEGLDWLTATLTGKK